MEKLPRALAAAPFTRRQAIEHGISRRGLEALVREGTVELLVHGVYCATSNDVWEEAQFRAATLRVGSPSAICLISALAHHGLTDVIPKKIWIMVPSSKRTAYRDLKVFRTRNPAWEIGINQHDGYAITSVERTLVDTLHYRAKVGTQVGIDALKQSLALKKTTLNNVVDTATRLGLAHRIRDYLEALA